VTVLVLAGTSEAAALVARLVDLDIDVVASLAGRTSTSRSLPCPVRVGGFGGVEGLAAELRARKVHALVDATHPFADQMPWHARNAAALVGIPHLRLTRPAWPARANWIEVDSPQGAAEVLHGRVLLTLGRHELDAFRHNDGMELVVRSVDQPPDGPWTTVMARGPFSYDDEVALLRAYRIEMVVTRNSGGPTAKLDAADAVGARVVAIRRPPPVDAPTVTDVDAAVSWLAGLS
jgi:precorrin-6A/cobalt-precorrin-6A reductase